MFQTQAVNHRKDKDKVWMATHSVCLLENSMDKEPDSPGVTEESDMAE